MTFKNWLTLHRVLILLCLLMVPLLIYKGVGIAKKISSVNTAEQHYQENRLIEAEEWFTKAKDNRFLLFLYKEELIASRLSELAPITSIREGLSDIASEAYDATNENDFDRLLEAYEELKHLRSSYLEPEGEYSDDYRKLSEMYGITPKFTDYFKSFRNSFLSQLGKNDSAKWNLLRIPSHFFASEEAWHNELSSLFRQNDETQLEQSAREGRIEDMLRRASTMLTGYERHEFQSPWVIAKIETLMEEQLRKDWDNEQVPSFTLHAKQLAQFVTAHGYNSNALQYAEKGISLLMQDAKQKIANGQYEKAIELYTALSQYKDMQQEIAAVQHSWILADPSRILPALPGGSNYTLTTGGVNEFGAQAYAAAITPDNKLYWGRMNSDGSIRIMSSEELTPQEQVTELAVNRELSTAMTPVIVVKSTSDSRHAIFAAYEVQEGRIVQLFRIEADDISYLPDGSLHAVNPTGEGEGQTAIFKRIGDIFHFAGIAEVALDISTSEITHYPNKLIRFTTSIIESGNGEALAYSDGNYLLLKGEGILSQGSIRITGRFTDYVERFISEAPAIIEKSSGSKNEYTDKDNRETGSTAPINTGMNGTDGQNTDHLEHMESSRSELGNNHNDNGDDSGNNSELLSPSLNTSDEYQATPDGQDGSTHASNGNLDGNSNAKSNTKSNTNNSTNRLLRIPVVQVEQIEIIPSHASQQ